MILQICNFCMVLFGLLSIWLANTPEGSIQRKYACIAGLAAQPFWFYYCYETSQWGIFVLTIAYTLCWIKGFVGIWVTHK